ncbi:hypothetical protein HBI56_192880 [Parastagonospora nodorum]|uniref:Metalloendopeptidase n=1 Tax=Phaeosphaeria nodorum (strain SN15 / ATCC MYA-4574 / FGSC 10173) TaxID=321614 RepID=A0A7U2NPW1_PHANO|nr:hypothetical protein HBH56_177460 [Parastagonospora nodorum]QRD06075.1 hypothetical protein JI435_146400 [Parastagonospora nodorum SN15]KAH3931956.1 hypothetical protein HBH54_092360 [Parastagonospora nodorum]KAH3939628.1 hypothetical protein HBH53_232070 [Parastagonospora nodorum]KAH3957484.1 hypothetical protein HBH51_224040 [Parastagonospora nodorum]
MRFSSTFTLAFVAVATACYFPFNDAHFTNVTYATEVFANLNPQSDMGWTSVVNGDSAVKPWPLVPAPPTDLPGEEGLVTVPYCYKTAEDRVALKETIEGGIEIWRKALPEANAVNGHRFAGFREYGRDGLYPTCVDPKTDFWNPAVRHGTLQIQRKTKDGQSTWATVGYIPRDAGSSTGPGGWEDRHQLQLEHNPGSDGEWRKFVAAHELGHVIGFVHEHQRHDRDSWVSFNCENLAGYWDIKEIVEAHPEWKVDMGQVCSSNYYGSTPELQWWSVLAYSKDMGVIHGKPTLQTFGKVYDDFSIMQYPSEANSFWDAEKIDQYPLVKWKKTGDQAPPTGTKPTKENADFIRQPAGVSAGDVEGVKMMYPW